METPQEHTEQSTESPFDFLSGDFGMASDNAFSGEQEPSQDTPEQAQSPEGGFEAQEGAVQPEQGQIDTEEQRVRDWQSKFDSLQSEFNQYKQSAESANAVWRTVQSDPQLASQVLSTIEQSLSGNGSSDAASGVAQQSAESTPMPQEPTPPEKPAEYSEHDSVMEPGSASWNYRKAMEQYKEDTFQYRLDKQAAQFQQMVQPIAQTLEQQQQQQRQNEQLRAIHSSFVESGLSPEQTGEVVNWASQYQVTAEDIAMLYRMRTGQGQAPMQQQAPAQAQRQQRPDYPLPSAVAGAAQQEPKKATGDQMMSEILALEKATSAF